MDELNPDQLPDARLSAAIGTRARKEVPSPIGYVETIYCVNCGTSGGGILKDWSPYVFYLCDSCAEKWGKLDLPEIPMEVLRGERPLIQEGS